MTVFRKIVLGFVLVILLVVGLLGGHLYLEHRKEVQLYQRGFRLLEEQLAVYIKEHYSGVSKVEFTDISGYRYYAMGVQPIITDSYGNSSYLEDSVNGMYGQLGIGGLETLRYNSFGEPIIYLKNFDKQESIEVSSARTLPKEAKLSSHKMLDNQIKELVQQGKIKGVQKSDQGSPGMKIVYNLKVSIKD